MPRKMQFFNSLVRTLYSNSYSRHKPCVIFTQKCSSYSQRSHTCGELGLGHVGTRVTVAGWLQSTRLDKFLLIRDRTGICQVKIPENSTNFNHIKDLPNESVLVLQGVVIERPEGQENPKMETGDIEVELEAVQEISKADPHLPFQQSKHLKAKEPLRLQYRYLDLRRPDLQYNLAIRSALTMKMREFLTKKKFLDIETPTLFRRTPGGAKEFIVPSRTPNKFYSLVQSPQQFKQLLMVGGLDRYFQIARCYRDEGGKSDRQPEFTQLDIEMSFVDREGIIDMIEDLITYCWPENLVTPFEQMFYEDAINNYGVDKPDLRFSNKIVCLNQSFDVSGFDFIEKRISDESFFVGGILFDGSSTKRLKNIEKDVRLILADHLKDCKERNSTIIISQFSKIDGLIDNSILKKCNKDTRAKVDSQIKDNQIGFIVCGEKDDVLPVLGRLRTEAARELILDLDERPNKFLWVVDFPLFVMEDGKLESAHHPFTAPHPDDRHMFRYELLLMLLHHLILVMF